MITSIVFSKDRPLQLDLCLRSIKKNFTIIDKINVFFNFSSDEMMRQYAVLMEEHPDVRFWHDQQRLFSKLYIFLLGIRDYVILFTDDDIVYSKVESSYDDVEFVLNNIEITCISYRLGANITHRAHNNVLMPDILPSEIYKVTSKHLAWNLPPGFGYWAYPLSVDGHLFRAMDIRHIIKTIAHWPEVIGKKQTPNLLEAMMQRFYFEFPHVMSSELFSRVVNSPNNRVQHEYKNAHGQAYGYNTDILLKAYTDGFRANLDALSQINVICPHTELNILHGYGG